MLENGQNRENGPVTPFPGLGGPGSRNPAAARGQKAGGGLLGALEKHVTTQH